MLYNILSIISLGIVFLIFKVLEKAKNGENILKVFSCILFIYKTISYIRLNIIGYYTIPVEISSLSYFILPIIITFGIKKYYHISSFLGIIAGLGFFAFYSTLGFTVENDIPLSGFFVGIFCHGYLLVAGLYLFKKYNFTLTNKLSIWLVIIEMVNWALVFFDVEMRGITFIYYIISPTFLNLFSSVPLNYLFIIIYYLILILLFGLVVKEFYKLNSKIHKKIKNNNYF